MIERIPEMAFDMLAWKGVQSTVRELYIDIEIEALGAVKMF
ncbi:hypothetical protein [Bacteroides sp. 224]|nr:hypothetical protein [Bacteroides sp. 224]